MHVLLLAAMIAIRFAVPFELFLDSTIIENIIEENQTLFQFSVESKKKLLK